PNFPPQKLVVIYNTQTATVIDTRVMFKDLYDEVRAGTTTLPNYPGGNGASFFSSGRLPYMVQIETNLGGVKKLLNLVDIHARANSGSDIARYNMRKYDAQVLKDSLDLYYANSNLVILGDYNDDVKASVITPNPSSYKMFVDDQVNYNALTLGISQAGAFSYLSSSGFLDHIMISNELNDDYIQNSIAVYDPRTDIANYTNTTSDHGPVIARFELKATNLSTIDYETKNGYYVQAFPNPTTDVLNVVVKANNDKILKLNLYDISGHLVTKPVEINANQDLSTTVIPVNYLQSGIYVYTLTENNKIVYKSKIIKK
ncbi:MAG: T9SS type A sorting domain-containing protein, partial [Flavobacterium sp.]